MHVRTMTRLPAWVMKYNKLLQIRHSSSATNKMCAWQIHQYGGVEELTFNDATRMAGIKGPKDLLVKVHACSINPIDLRMMGGYGRVLINVLRKRDGIVSSGSEFPIILGRDFSGTVVKVGQNVTRFQPGDEVWGAITPAKQGTYAEYALVSQNEISKKPQTLSHVEAASIPYVAATAWTALCTVGQLKEIQAVGKRLLILGGSGGIGTFATQLAKAWGMDVTVTCGSDATDLMANLGADHIVDYHSGDAWRELKSRQKFDMILDCVGGDVIDKSLPLLSPWSNAKLVTLLTPLLKNSDSLGVLPGMALSALKAGADTLKGLRSGGSVRWVVFAPNGAALDRVRQMVESNQIKPIIQETFPFKDIPKALMKVKAGHLRGKIVVEGWNNPETESS